MLRYSSIRLVVLVLIGLFAISGCTTEADSTNGQCQDCGNSDAGDTNDRENDSGGDADADNSDADDSNSDADNNDADNSDADNSDADGECVPNCEDIECGEDPVCGVSCGECPDPESQVTWRVDGTVVHESTSVELAASGGQYAVTIYMPDQGRNVQISASAASQGQGYSLSCDDDNWTSTALMSLNTFDNGWADLDDVPQAWQGLNFNNTHCTTDSTSGDVVTAWELAIDEASSQRAVGSFSMTIEGHGERAGSTLEIDGEFDAEL